VGVISIVVPVFNEEAVIPLFYSRLDKVLSELEYQFEIIFVNDGSNDNTLGVCKKLCVKDSRVAVINLSRNFGHMSALTAGIDYSKGEAVICMDGDLQHPPELIPQMIERWLEGYDIVFTVRRQTQKVNFFKHLTAEFFYGVFNGLSAVKIHKNAADFRLISREVAEVLRKDIRERHRFMRGLVSWVGFSSCSLDFVVEKRCAGESKYSFFKMLRFAVIGITSFSVIPLRVSFFLGLFIAFCCLLYGAYAIYMKLVAHSSVPGWASLVVGFSFISSLQLVFLGLLGEYIGYIFEEVKGRPIYIVEGVFSGPESAAEGCRRIDRLSKNT
jgi:polyisoprenyl-phosphate glycosyltransferase